MPPYYTDTIEDGYERSAPSRITPCSATRHESHASRVFYEQLLGMKVVWEPDPDNVYFSSRIGQFRLTPDSVIRACGASIFDGAIIGSYRCDP